MLSCRRVRADKDIAAMLAVRPGARLWVLERVRFTNRQPVSLQTSFLPYDLCPGLAHRNLEATSGKLG